MLVRDFKAQLAGAWGARKVVVKKDNYKGDLAWHVQVQMPNPNPHLKDNPRFDVLLYNRLYFVYKVEDFALGDVLNRLMPG